MLYRTHPQKLCRLSAVAMLLLSGCVAPIVRPPKTALQMREMQTRSYEFGDSNQVQKAVFDVLQDDGYVVKNAEVSLGLLTATKEQPVEGGRSSNPFGGGFALGHYGGMWGGQSAQEQWPALEVLEASVNVTPHGKLTKVRVTFQRRVLNNFGGPISSEMIEDLAFYQDFFSRVDKSLFLLRQKL